MLDDTSYSMTTADKLRSKRIALDKATNIAQPALDRTQATQLGQAFAKPRAQVANLAEQGGLDSRTGIQSALGKAAKTLADVSTQQNTEKTKANIGLGMQEEDLIRTRQVEEIQKFTRDQEKAQYDTGEAIARKAFDMGMDTKELVASNNAIVADAALNRMRQDFEAGRVNERELLQVSAKMQTYALEQKGKFDALMAQLQADLQRAMTEDDLKALEARQAKAMQYLKEALESSAKGANIGMIISSAAGIASIVSPVVGGAIAVGGAIYSSASK
jgi:uncharacterized protein (DUF885 family)